MEPSARCRASPLTTVPNTYASHCVSAGLRLPCFSLNQIDMGDWGLGHSTAVIFIIV